MNSRVTNLRKLRPAKVRSAVRRRVFEHRLGRLQPARTVRTVDVGTAYGGWRIPLDLVDGSWTCWCIGAGGDVSFDLALAERGAAVRVVEPVEHFADQARGDLAPFPSAQVFHAALTPTDGPVRMGRHHQEHSRSLSNAGLYESSVWVDVPGRSLPSLLAEAGDQRVELLKLDVEGAEYDLIPQLDLEGLGVRVFSTQLHHTRTAKAGLELVEHLAERGYRLIAQRPTVKLTFVADQPTQALSLDGDFRSVRPPHVRADRAA